MIQFILQLIVAILGGIASGLQAPFAGIMGQKVGDVGSVFFTYAVGALAISIIALFMGGGSIGEWRSVPPYAFLSGLMGLVIVGSLSYTVPRLGAATAITVFVLSWLTFSVMVDHFGWFGVEARPIDLSRVAGLGALLLGTWLVVR